MRGRLAALALFLAAVGPASALQAPPRPDDLAARVQQHYDGVRDFAADFTDVYQSGVLPQQTTQHGTVEIKKPDRMRWQYAGPEKNLLVADGTRLWWYVPADRRVDVSTIPTGNAMSTPLLFLAGKGNLTRDFRVAMPVDQPADAWRLDLTPIAPDADFDALSLIVDRRTLALRGLVTVGRQGDTSTFTFAHLRENASLSDKDFVFTPPKGVEVNEIVR